MRAVSTALLPRDAGARGAQVTDWLTSAVLRRMVADTMLAGRDSATRAKVSNTLVAAGVHFNDFGAHCEKVFRYFEKVNGVTLGIRCFRSKLGGKGSDCVWVEGLKCIFCFLPLSSAVGYDPSWRIFC